MDMDRKIDARSVVTLITFIVVNILVIVPLYIPIPLPLVLRHDPGRRVKWAVKWFKLGLETAPVIGVLLLLASTCIPGKVVRDGIVGSGGVKPYDIMTLFLCFAYISLSLDSTGLLRYLAFKVGNKYSSSGSRLYAAFYAFFAVTGLLVGNDPLILSGTPFLVYFTDHASIDPPIGFLFTHFQISNLVSALLVSSNPTNLVLTSAFHISFLKYSAWLALPTVASAIILYPILRFWTFRKVEFIPRQLYPPHVDAKAALHDEWGGIFGSVLFLITIVLLVGLSAGGKLEKPGGWTGVWIVVLPAASAMATWDCVGDLRDPERRNRAKAAEARGPILTNKPAHDAAEIGADEPKPNAAGRMSVPTSEGRKMLNGEKVVMPSAGSTTHASDMNCQPRPVVEAAQGALEPRPSPHDPFSLFAILPFSVFAKHFPTSTDVFRRMPWNLVPFAFSMFILVEALQYTGWIRIFGGWWAAWVRADSTGVVGSVWLMGVLSVSGCNVFGTNIGATILLSRVLQYWVQTSGPVSNRTLYGAVYALAVGSNFGAYSFVFSASLAGLLWRTILAQKDRTVTQLEFFKYNWIPVIITMIVGCLIVAGEVCIIY